MKRIYWLIIIFAIALQAKGQSDYKISIHSKTAAGKKVYLASFYGERIAPVDSLFADKTGTSTFYYKKVRASGMYRYIEDKNKHTDFIFNKEDIEITIDYGNTVSPVLINQSKENTLFYSFLKDQDYFRNRIDPLMPLLDYYPSEDPFYKQIRQQIERLQADWQDKLNYYIVKNYSTYASKLIAVKKVPAYNLNVPESDKKQKFREDFFKDIPFSDTALIRSNVYPVKIIDYLSLWANPQLEQKKLEQEFIKAVDVLFSTVPMDPRVNDFVLTYLVGGFEKFKFEDVLVHISTKYLSALQCHDDKVKKSLASRIEAYEKMAVGKTSPDFRLMTENGKIVTRDSIPAQYCLLLFWASWCPHCLQMFPEVVKLTSGFSPEALKVVTISLDTSAVAYKTFISKSGGGQLNFCDFKGWDGRIMVDFHIYATPTMFLIDRQRKIISKPLTIGDLTDALQELKLM